MKSVAITTRLISSGQRGVRDLNPASFALVMATGILTIGCHLEGLQRAAETLAVIGAIVFAGLTIATLLRCIFFPGELRLDLRDYHRCFGFLTIVAGLGVLSSALLLVFGAYRLPLMLWVLDSILWLIFIYSIFAALIVKWEKPVLSHGIHGGWLLAVVATEAIAQLTLLLLPRLPGRDGLLLLSLALWLSGGMLYIWMISLIFYRYTFFVVDPEDLKSSYWIDMGAMAIASVVGALLAENIGGSAFADLGPFIRGFTILFWATASWWIPMLAILAVWRHAVRRVPFVYDALYWAAVFPLGMYAVATFELAKLTGIGFLFVVAKYVLYIALAAWLVVMTEMLRAIYRGVQAVENVS